MIDLESAFIAYNLGDSIKLKIASGLIRLVINEVSEYVKLSTSVGTELVPVCLTLVIIHFMLKRKPKFKRAI